MMIFYCLYIIRKVNLIDGFGVLTPAINLPIPTLVLLQLLGSSEHASISLFYSSDEYPVFSSLPKVRIPENFGIFALCASPRATLLSKLI